MLLIWVLCDVWGGLWPTREARQRGREPKQNVAAVSPIPPPFFSLASSTPSIYQAAASDSDDSSDESSEEDEAPKVRRRL